jgi:hypothetical protein
MMWGFVAGAVVMLTGVIFGALVTDPKSGCKHDCYDCGVKYTPLASLMQPEKLVE